ncbi:hypothetical protein B0A48_05954 [Cryoendolithus antarcticus]|uniref:Uncharacterized protein n=1 Tax=Cryoendolithus antarcticus TaxID=1507870 RepID=A0A1V8TCF7_9PEZI|nr:hypothetical protein B0A48_05954 [Cryoendolithus antarcticus]
MSSAKAPTPSIYAQNESRRVAALPPTTRFDDSFGSQLRFAPSPTDSSDLWNGPRSVTGASYAPQTLTAGSQPWGSEEWYAGRRAPALQESSAWSTSQANAQYQLGLPNRVRGDPSSPWGSTWPPPMLRRSSSEHTNLSQLPAVYAGQTSDNSKNYPQRRPSNRDEFDGPSQLLDKPVDADYEPKEEDLPQLPISLYAQEQDEILTQVNDRLSQCAYDFVARYQFPIPLEPDKRPVRVPSDREWSEWVYLLKRLATKRRIPSRVLYNGQIKQLITILENSLEMRHAAKHQSRPLKDDRNVLQLVSSGLQVAKIVKDAPAMGYLDALYVRTEMLITSRRGGTVQGQGSGFGSR